MKKVVVIGSDHAGFSLKNDLIKFLHSHHIEVEDMGTYNEDSVNFATIAQDVAKNVAANKDKKGILVCGTGIGMSMMANKIVGIRAALVHDLFSAKATREHNDANILCMGARIIAPAMAVEIMKVWLDTEFLGGKYGERIRLIEDYEQKHCLLSEKA